MSFIKYQKLYLICLIGALATLTFIGLFFVQIFYVVLLVAAIGLLCYWFFKRMKKMEMLRLLKIMDADCDPELFIKKAKQIVTSHFAFRITRDMYHFSIVVALNDLNKKQEAYDELNGINFKRLKKNNVFYELQYYGLLIYYYIESNNMNEALKLIFRLKDLVERYKKNKKTREIAESVWDGIEMHLHFEKEEYETCYDYYESKFNYSQRNNIRQKVVFAYKLGIMNLEQDIEKAKAYFNYVIQYGNKIYVVKEAGEHMKLLV